MKQIVFLIIISVTSCLAQKTIDWHPKEINPVLMPLDDQGEIRFREVVPIPKISVGATLKRVRTWAAKTYPSANEMTQQFDTTQGVMVIKGAVKLKQGAMLGHKLIVEAKDGRYRVTIDELSYTYEITTPVKLRRDIPIHSYGCTADDYYDLTMFVATQSGSQSIGLMNFKKLAVKQADNQRPMLEEVKQTMEALLASLKKAVESDGDW
jgi:hypothetical protein